MVSGKRVLVVLVILAVAAGIVWGADQTRDRLKDGTGDGEPDRLQLQDGSCNDEAVEVAQDVGRPDERGQGGSGNGDRDQDQDQDQDGEESEPDRDQTRSRDCTD